VANGLPCARTPFERALHFRTTPFAPVGSILKAVGKQDRRDFRYRQGTVIRCGSILFLRFQLLDECSEMRGDGSCEGVVLVLKAFPNSARSVFASLLSH
jgi:hypothetical protein